MKIIIGRFIFDIFWNAWSGLKRNEVIYPFKSGIHTGIRIGFRILHKEFIITYLLPMGVWLKIASEKQMFNNTGKAK